MQRFKQTAFHASAFNPPLRLTFSLRTPFTILFSYRGPSGTRHFANNDEFISILSKSFSSPEFNLKCVNNSDSRVLAEDQIRWVAEANVVITNHGAFEGNLIYMRNGSLIVEIGGNYDAEYHFFEWLAQTFGIFYVRTQTKLLLKHKDRSFDIMREEIDEVISVVMDYFSRKPFLFNS